jgi:hypothetical protein
MSGGGGRPEPDRTAAALSRVVFLGLAALAAFVLVQGGLFRPAEWIADPGNSPRFFPGLVLCLAVGCGLWLGLVGDGETVEVWPARNVGLAAAILAALGLFVWLFRVVGWAPATALLALGLPPVLGYRRPLPILLFGAILLAFIWVVFVLAMNVRLPTGTVWR